MKEKIIKLKNGGVLIYKNSKLNNCSAVEVGFSVGAFAENKPGTAHLLEHTLFKKTKNRTNKEVEADRTKIAFLNASTSMDFLVVKFYRSNKIIKETFEFASDVLLNSCLDDEFFESEKGVVSEELLMCLDGESRDVYVKNYKQAQSGAKFSSDVVGKSVQNIKRLKFQDLKSFKQKHFVGNNFICSVVSSLPLFKVEKLVNKYFTDLIPFDEKYKKPKSYFDSTTIDKDSSLKLIKNNQEKITVQLSFKIDENEIEIFSKNFNYSFLARYFSGVQGELFARLRNKGLIYRLDSDYSCFKEDSLFNLVFETSNEKIKEIINLIAEEVNNIIQKGVSAEYIEAFKKNFDYLADEKMPVRMSAECHLNLMDYLSFGKVFKLTDKQKKKLVKEVSCEGVTKVAEKIFAKNNKMFVTVLGNVSKNNVPTLEEFKKKFLIKE